MAIRPEEVAPDAVFTERPPTPPTPQLDGKDRSTWNGWPSRNTAQPRVISDEQERITRIRTPVMDLEGHMTPTHLFYVVQHFAVPEPIRQEDWQMTVDGAVQYPVTFTYAWQINKKVKETTTTTATTSVFDLAGRVNNGDLVTVTVTATDSTLSSPSATMSATVRNH